MPLIFTQVLFSQQNENEIFLTSGYDESDFIAAVNSPDINTITFKTDITITNSITIPPNKVLRFFKENLLVIGIGGNLIFDNAFIDAGKFKIFEGNNLEGTIINDAIYPEWFGAIVDDEVNDSNAIQQAVDLAKGMDLYLSSGTYVLETPVSYMASLEGEFGFRNLNARPGVKITGEGVNKTKLINKSNDYAFKVLGVKDKANDTLKIGVKQTNGYFKNFTIQTINDGSDPKGGFLLFSAIGFKFQDLKILGNKNTFSESAIYVPLISNIYEDIGFSSLNDLENYFDEEGKDIINIDPYGSWRTIINDVEIDYCDGFGVYGENALGFNFKSTNLTTSRCKKGGIYTAGHSSRIIGGAIVGCGESSNSDSGGIIVERDGANPNGLVIQDVEFDGNYNFHLWVKSSINANISYNRFVNNKKIINACKFEGTASNYLIKGINFNNNFFRFVETDYNDENFSGPEHAVIIDEKVSQSAFQNNIEQNLNFTPSNQFYLIDTDINGRNNIVIHNGDILITDIPYFSVYLDNTNDQINIGENILNWPDIFKDNYSGFNVDSYEVPKSGLYSLIANIGFTGLPIGEQTIFEFVIIDGANVIPYSSTFYKSTTNSHNSIQISCTRYLNSETKIGIRIRSYNSSFSLLNSKHLSSFSGTLLNK